MRERRDRQGKVEASFPFVDRVTVSGHCVGDLCFVCASRVILIAAEEGIVLAWCGCALPEDHHEMELLESRSSP